MKRQEEEEEEEERKERIRYKADAETEEEKVYACRHSGCGPYIKATTVPRLRSFHS
jgi:hypothetical protein